MFMCVDLHSEYQRMQMLLDQQGFILMNRSFVYVVMNWKYLIHVDRLPTW